MTKAVAEESYLTLTGSVVAFAFWMGAGWLIGGRLGMLVAAVLVTLRYAIAIWHAAYYPTSHLEKEHHPAAPSPMLKNQPGYPPEEQ